MPKLKRIQHYGFPAAVVLSIALMFGGCTWIFSSQKRVEYLFSSLQLKPQTRLANSDSNHRIRLTASGGTGSGTRIEQISGPGTFDPVQQVFIPSTLRGESVFRVTDAQGKSAITTIFSLPIWTDGEIFSYALSGNSLFIGGNFRNFGRTPAPRFVSLNPSSGALASDNCNIQEGFNGDVKVILRTENAIFVGGWFTRYRNQDARNLAKLDLQCELDTVFTRSGSDGGFDGRVLSLAVKGDSLYVGGVFTQYRAGVYGANSARNLAKIDLNTGILDQNFTQSGVNGGFNAIVNALVLVGNSLYVGGNFTSYRSSIYGSNSANRLAKLDADSGVLDPVFTQSGVNGGFNQEVLALVASADSLYVGGLFSRYRSATYGTYSANSLAKLNLNSGILDQTFTQSGMDGGFDGPVNTLVASSSSIYVGGSFSQYRAGTYGAASANYLAKLDLVSGSLDQSFTQSGFGAGFDWDVYALALQGSSLYVGGAFEQYRSATYGARSANYLAKLDAATGVLDQSFTQPGFAGGFNSSVTSLGVSANTLYVAGSFTVYRASIYAPDSAMYLAKIDLTTGSLDPVFNRPGQGFNSMVQALEISGDSLYVGGTFTQYRAATYGSNSAMYLAKLNILTGDLDQNFTQSGANGGFNAGVMDLAVQGSSLYVGGSFTQYRSATYGANSANRLAKLDLNSGVLDQSFTQSGVNGGFDLIVNTLAVNGTSLYVGGNFTAYRSGVYGINSAQGIAKLNLSSGVLDQSFTQAGTTGGFGNEVHALAVSGSSLYVGGSFSSYRPGTYGATSAGSLAKLDLSSGLLDTSFTLSGVGGGFDGSVRALVVSGDSLYVGGSFNTYRPATYGATMSANNLAKLNLLSGALDTQFTRSGLNSGVEGIVYSLAVSPSGIIIGGAFGRYRGLVLSNGGVLHLQTGDPR